MLNKRAKKAVETRLDKMGIKYKFIEADLKLIVSEEFNEKQLADPNYPYSMNDDLVTLSNFMDKKYGINFETISSGAFGIILETY